MAKRRPGRRTERGKRNEKPMAARKDDGQEPPAGGRQTVIWRLPATANAAESTDEPDVLDAEPDRPGKRPKDRRVPLPVVWGLAAALVCVGLYAAWSEFGSDILTAGGEPDAASTSASATPSAEQPVGGATGGGASASPPSAGENPPLVAAEEDTGEGTEANPVAGSARVVDTRQGDKTGSTEAATQQPAPPAPDQAPSSVAIPDDEPPAVPAATSAGEEAPTAPERVAEPTAEASADAIAEIEPRSESPVPVAIGTDALVVLNARLDALEAGTSGAIDAGTAVIALEQRVRALEDDPAREPLGQALAAWDEQRDALEATLAEVSARLARFEEETARQSAADGRLVALVLATGELTAALGSSRPFPAALDALRGIAGEDPEIEGALARLAPFAATGVPTLDGLSARFPEAANAMVRATPAAEDSDWLGETVDRLSQLVTIRRTGGAIDPASLDGRLVEAESALGTGDLGRAIAIVEALLTGDAAAGMALSWLLDARARAESDAALAALSAIVHARIGARWAAAGEAQ